MLSSDAGRASAWSAIAVAHGEWSWATCRRTTPAEEAADVYQEVLTTAWRKIHAVPDDQDHALAWLLAVARRTLANHRRLEQPRLAATDRLAAELAAQHLREVSRPERSMRSGSGLRSWGRTTGDLTCRLGGLTTEQVGAVFGISPAAARKRLQRARERLSARMTRTGDRALDGRRRCPGTRQVARRSRLRAGQRRDNAIRVRGASRRSPSRAEGHPRLSAAGREPRPPRSGERRRAP